MHAKPTVTLWKNHAIITYMDKLNPEKLASVEDIANVTHTSAANARRVYLHNPQKRKMYCALSIGAYFLDDQVTSEELRIAKEIIMILRERDA